jgi:hypothetical protein
MAWQKIKSPGQGAVRYINLIDLFLEGGSVLTTEPLCGGGARAAYFPLDSLETVSFDLPFARRLASTFLPLAVCIRLRNP